MSSRRNSPPDGAAGPPFSVRVQGIVGRIPRGKVLAYGGVAALLGTPRAARGVGRVLSSLPEGTDVPWWRVVNARGCISLHGYPALLQRMMLEAEGVRFGRGGRIDWKQFGWDPSPAPGRRWPPS